jgi:hypothetical protein
MIRRVWRDVARRRDSLLVPRLRTPGVHVSDLDTGPTGGY